MVTIRLATALALAAVLTHSASAEAAKPHFINVDLIAETAQPTPGGSALVGLRMVPNPGWHSYWSNPGEAGFPTVVEWKAPAGVRFGPLRHPAPSLIQVAGMASYVHEGPHVLIARMTLDRGISAGTAIPVTAEVSWAACSEKLCVPEKATLSMQLTAGNGPKSAEATMLHRALAREPRPVSGGGFDVEGRNLLIELPAAARLNAAEVRFFPDENGVAGFTKGRVVSKAPIRISVPVTGDVPEMLGGVATDGSSAYRLNLIRKTSVRATPNLDANSAKEKGPETRAKPATNMSDAPEYKSEGLHDNRTGGGTPGTLTIGGMIILAMLSLLAIALLSRCAADCQQK